MRNCLLFLFVVTIYSGIAAYIDCDDHVERISFLVFSVIAVIIHILSAWDLFEEVKDERAKFTMGRYELDTHLKKVGQYSGNDHSGDQFVGFNSQTEIKAEELEKLLGTHEKNESFPCQVWASSKGRSI